MPTLEQIYKPTPEEKHSVEEFVEDVIGIAMARNIEPRLFAMSVHWLIAFLDQYFHIVLRDISHDGSL